MEIITVIIVLGAGRLGEAANSRSIHPFGHFPFFALRVDFDIWSTAFHALHALSRKRKIFAIHSYTYARTEGPPIYFVRPHRQCVAIVIWSHTYTYWIYLNANSKLFSVGHARTHRTARYATMSRCLELAFEICVHNYAAYAINSNRLRLHSTLSFLH